MKFIQSTLLSTLLIGLNNEPVQAHKDFSAEFDLNTLDNEKSNDDLDLSLISNSVSKITEKMTVFNKFSDDKARVERGEIVLTKNEKTNEILKVEMVENEFSSFDGKTLE